MGAITAGTKVAADKIASTYAAVNKALHPEIREIQLTPEDHGLYNYHEVNISSTNLGNISGWLFTSQNQSSSKEDKPPIVIFGHGYGMNRVNNHPGVFETIKALREKGIDSLIFDFPHHGKSNSEKVLTTFGMDTEVNSMKAVIDYVRDKNKLNYSRIALMGISMGSVTALNTAADYHDKVQAVVADSPYSDFGEYLSESIRQWTNKIHPSHAQFILNRLPLLLGIHPKKYSPIRSIKELAKRNFPVLLIHNEGDELIPAKHSKALKDEYLYTFENTFGDAENSSPPISTLFTNVKPDHLPEFDGRLTGHCRSIDIPESGYIEKLANFCYQYLKENVTKQIPENDSKYSRGLVDRLKGVSQRTNERFSVFNPRESPEQRIP